MDIFISHTAFVVIACNINAVLERPDKSQQRMTYNMSEEFANIVSGLSHRCISQNICPVFPSATRLDAH